jgi:hypothetical protein
MKFELHHQTEEIVYDDVNGNTVESPRGYWFRIVGNNGTTLAASELRLARRASVRKVIREIVIGMGGDTQKLDQLIVDQTGEDDA